MLGSRDIFEKNLSLIRKRSPQLANALEAANCDGIEEGVGPRGARTLREGGILLGSAYDPVLEAEQMATTMAAEPADIMVAIGFGLGKQFPFYRKKNPGTVIVHEPSPARLRAALHSFSLANLYGANNDFYISTDLDQFSRLLDQRYFPSLRIRVFPHPAVLRIDPTAVNRAVERTRRVKDSADTGKITAIEHMVPWSQIVAKNGRRIASSASLGVLRGLFKDKPAVIVAAGPSLDKQLELLKEREDEVLIIAIGQTVKALTAAGIRPHLVHILESKNVAHQLTDCGTALEQNAVLSPDCHPDTYDVPVASSFVATPSVDPMGRWIETVRGNPCLTIGGGTVALGAVGLAQTLGANPVMLIGQDLAFTDGRAYAKNSAYDFIGLELSEDGKCNFTNGKQKKALMGARNLATVPDSFGNSEIVWVEGWTEGERVPTWLAYATFIEQYRDTALHFARGGTRLVNCTEGGARIPQIEHIAFRRMLDDLTGESIDAFSKIEEAYASAPTKTFKDFVPAMASARKTLDRISAESKKAMRFIQRAEKNSSFAQKDQQTLDTLKRLARYDKKLRKQLTLVPWLDALVQPEVHKIMAAVRRTERLDPTAEEVSQESKFLFQAVRNGVDRAREWFDEFEASFDETNDATAERKVPGETKSEKSTGSPFTSMSP